MATEASVTTSSGKGPFSGFHDCADVMDEVYRNRVDAGLGPESAKSMRLRVPRMFGSKDPSDWLKSTFQATWMITEAESRSYQKT